jgi:ribose-phosphate pyrophosphokinase
MTNDNKFLIFSGSANEKLAGEIARHLHGKLGQSVLDVFSDGEIRFQSHENVRGADVFIVQSLCADSNFHIMRCCRCRRLKRASARASRRYHHYLRAPGPQGPAAVAISARLLADLLETAGFSGS